MKVEQGISRLGNQRGVSLIEMLIVLGIFGLLIHIALVVYVDYRRKAYNTYAISDGRNLATVVSNTMIEYEDVDFTHDVGDGRELGTVDTKGNDRSKVYTLSKGVRARIIGSTSFYPGGQGFMEAYLYHENGSDDPATPSEMREYLCIVDELSGVISFSTF